MHEHKLAVRLSDHSRKMMGVSAVLAGRWIQLRLRTIAALFVDTCPELQRDRPYVYF